MESSAELELLERISNLLRSESRAAANSAGVQPIQLEILEYLDRCNRYSDTPAGVADFLGITKGTASQSILRLEEKGFLDRKPDDEDRRVSHLKLTAAGRREAQGSWRRPLLEAISGTLDRKEHLADQLTGVLKSLQAANENRSFGVCQSCRFFERRGPKSFRCGLTQERLSVRDSSLLCREHEHVVG